MHTLCLNVLVFTPIMKALREKDIKRQRCIQHSTERQTDRERVCVHMQVCVCMCEFVHVCAQVLLYNMELYVHACMLVCVFN